MKFQKSKIFPVLWIIPLLALFVPAPAKSARAETLHEQWDHNSATELNSQTILQYTTLTPGKYYLSQDVSAAELKIEGTVELCLNGFRLDLTQNSIEVTGSDASLTLWDCEQGICNEHPGEHFGEIIGSSSDCAVFVSDGGTFTMEGGTIKGAQGKTDRLGAVTVNGASFTLNDGFLSENGCAGVFLQAGGSFTMNGGEISGNTESGNYRGAGVATGAADGDEQPCTIKMTNGSIDLNSGSGIGGTNPTKVEITGGTIEWNTSQSDGGGIYLQGGVNSSLTIGGSASITRNDAQNGGGIYYGTGTQGEDLLISDSAEICNNTASGNGGGIYLGQGASLTMTGGLIGGKVTQNGVSPSGNTAQYGGGVYVDGGSFTMTGGVIGYTAEEQIPEYLQGEPGNTADFGGGVYLRGGSFTLEEGIVGFEISSEQYEAGKTGQALPYGNSSTQDVNPGGSGIYASNSATVTMKGGKVIYNGGGASRESAAVYANQSTLEISGGEISFNPDGAEVTKEGTLTLSGSAVITKNEDYGIYVYEGGVLNITGGTISENTVGIAMQSTMLGDSSAVITGGTISGNAMGVQPTPNGLSLGGNPVIKDNATEGSPQNLILEEYTSITLLESFSGADVHVSLSPSGNPFTSGYASGMENCFTLDGEGKILPFELEAYDELQQPILVTELALSYHISFMDGEREIPELSGDYIAGSDVKDLLYGYDPETQEPVLLPEIQTQLAKSPSETSHFIFREFQNEQGVPYDFENDYITLEGDLTILVEYTEEEHAFGGWSNQDETYHTHTCQTCQYSAEEEHSYGAWSDDGDGNHSRTCPDCNSKQTEEHSYGAWIDDGDGNHSRTCPDCNSKQTEEHSYGAWIDDGANHSRTCPDCNSKQTEEHSYGTWIDDGANHSRTCPDCNSKQTEEHAYGAWNPTEGETWTRVCEDCGAQEVKEDERQVFAAARNADGSYTPAYTLQEAFDAAEEGQTVYLVCEEEGTEIQSTLVIRKSVSIGGVIRTVGEDFRAVYTPTDSSVLLKRAEGFTGAMIEILRGVQIRMDGLIVEGGLGTAVEVYGSLTVAGGRIEGECAVRVCAGTAQGISLLALPENGTLYVTGNPELIGPIRLDDPTANSIPAVDFEGFTGSATVEISDGRPYGAFAVNIGTDAKISVQGGANEQNGLSGRSVRIENGMALCGGYDLTLRQSDFGEITLKGECDEYLSSLEVSVNGKILVLNAEKGEFAATTCDTGTETLAEISVGGRSVPYSMVSFDETTGLMAAPKGAAYVLEGKSYELDGADPFAFALGKDSAAVTVDGAERILDFSRPVGTAFVYRYLTDDGVFFPQVDYSNYERVAAAGRVFEQLSNGQKLVVDEKLLSSPFRSFQDLMLALETYLSEQTEKAEEFLEQSPAAKEFESVSGEDREALEQAMEEYFNSDEEDRHFLDEAAREEGYSGFEGLIEDLISKSEFEEERKETLENLGTILRGCDGAQVRREFSLTIETVEGAVYERCTDDELRLDYLVGRKEALKTAVRVLENIRNEERVKNAFDEYLLEKRQSGCYLDNALAEMEQIVSAFKDELGAIDPECEDAESSIESVLSEGIARLNEVRANAVVSGEGSPQTVLGNRYPENFETLFGYLTSDEGFRGDSVLSLVIRPAEGTEKNGLVPLFGISVKIAENPQGAKVFLLLPKQARDFVGYRVTSASAEVFRDAETEGDVLIFDTEGETEFIVYAQRKVDLKWLMILLCCLCALETAGLAYLAGYLLKNRTAAFAPIAIAVIVPRYAGALCAALGAVCLIEAIAIIWLLCLIRRKEKSQNPQSK